MSIELDIWEELGIKPTRDVKAIKKAYAKQAAKHHPEEQPEKFQRINEAYQMAISMAREWVGQQEEQAEQEQPALHIEQRMDLEQQRKQQPLKDIYDSNFLGAEEEGLRQAERISEWAEKYAKENEQQRIRKVLHEQFLMEIALRKLNTFIVTDKFQPYEKWNSYLKDPIVLEALQYEEFLMMLTKKIKKCNFKPKTVCMIRQVLNEERLNGMLQGNTFKRILAECERTSHKKIRNERIYRAFFAFVIISVVLVQGFPRTWKRKTNDFRSIANIEKYINDKYHINATIKDSATEDLYGKVVGTNGKQTAHYIAETKKEGGVPSEFHLAWDRSSEQYKNIRDDFEYETVKMCADAFGLDLDGMQPSDNVIKITNNPVEELTPKFVNFFNTLQKSKYIQDGYQVNVNVQLSVMYSDRVTFTVNKNTKIHAEEVSGKLKKCMKESDLLNPKKSKQSGIQ